MAKIIKIDSGKAQEPEKRGGLTDVDRGDVGEQIKDKQANRQHRHNLIHWVEWVVSLWLFAVIAILILCGSSVIHLNDGVLDVLLATTTINILGLANIVLKGMFK